MRQNACFENKMAAISPLLCQMGGGGGGGHIKKHLHLPYHWF